MTSSAPAELSELLGHQRPRLLSLPAEVETSPSGEEAIELAAMAGLELDPWQQFVLHQSLAETSTGHWLSQDVGLVVSRQNGKGAVLEARELAGLFAFDEKLILHSAHQFDTAMEAFRRILQLIESTPDLDKLVRRVSKAHGEEGIETMLGTRLRFKARTARGGRGFSGDVVILDEAMYLPASVMSALTPTMSARPNPQLWYTGSAVDETEHPDGQVLTALRNRALAGGDPSLAYMEWSAESDPAKRPEEVDPRDRRLWAQANPALGRRISPSYVEKEQRGMLRRSFAVERLSVGAWPREAEDAGALDKVKWAALADPSSQPTDPIALSVDITPDRSRASIGIAAWRSDGRKHVELLRNREGTHWIVPSLLKIIARWDPAVLVLDTKGPAASLLTALAAKGIEPETVTAEENAAACAIFYDDLEQAQLAHLDQPAVNEAIAAVKKRNLSGGFGWTRSDGTDISPAYALTLASWALVAHGVAAAPPPPPLSMPIPQLSATGGHADVDLMTVGF